MSRKDILQIIVCILALLAMLAVGVYMTRGV